MASAASPSASASEGEIVDMVPDKASKAQPNMKDIPIDPRSRKYSPASASPSESSASHDLVTRQSRSRSRSPYRDSRRGEKRRRGGDHDGDRNHKRTFKVHYEDPRARNQRGDRDRYERRNERPRDRYRDENHGIRGHDRSRSRSRSPFSHRRSENTLRDHTSNHSRYSHDNNRAHGEKTSKSVSFHSSTKDLVDKSTVDSPKSNLQGDNSATSQHEDVVEVIDETAQIEARRLKREALKAKLRSQPSPLLAQALNAAVEPDHATPIASDITPNISRSASPAVHTPKAEAVDSPSALSIINDEDLINHRIDRVDDDADEPSAADYDPTSDMQEDRDRQNKHYQSEGMPAVTYDEMNGESHDVLMSDAKPVDPVKKPPKDEFDMFADDDDDDDMFAPENTKESDSEKTVKPKELAANLLDNWDDPDGYYRIIPGELLDGRYHVQATLGKGMFSAVVRAEDSTTGGPVAIKIIRNNETMKKAGLKEIDILQKLAEADPQNKKHVIRLEREFEHKGHLCMVFENLSINLREVLKKFGRDVGINLKAVRSYAQQMFLALSLLKKCNILHADIKPDNMLVNDARNILKVCDLGSAGDAADNDITPYLVSRFYRAPEIILGMPYDFALDMWSVGCTLFEMYTGKILFTGRNNNQMLRSMMECRGKFSLKMLKKSEFAGLHFDEKLMFMSAEKDKVTGKDTIRLLNFLKPTKDLKTRLLSAAKNLGEPDMKDLNLFIDLLDRCLALNPEKRMTPSEALKHPFIYHGKL